jgi:hypothetical protein
MVPIPETTIWEDMMRKPCSLHVEWDDPYDVGMTGLIGFASGYCAVQDCDVLLMVGTNFPSRQFYPQESVVRLAQVDVRAEQIGCSELDRPVSDSEINERPCRGTLPTLRTMETLKWVA